jgi:hypothetical protein
VLAALCYAAINPPSLPLVRIDAQFGVTPTAFTIMIGPTSGSHSARRSRERLEH